MESIKKIIEQGKSSLGIEFGSTRIKAILIDQNGNTLAKGIFDWENKNENGIWTYPEDEIWQGIQSAYRSLNNNVREFYKIDIKNLSAIGISAMMHGYLAFDEDANLLVPFRTWRNNITKESSKTLTKLFNQHIPQRWSISHLYQAILNNESHVKKIDYLTTLSGYIHWRLTGEKVLGICDASGMFPIDSETYNKKMIAQFEELISHKHYRWKLNKILPKVLKAGENAGSLSSSGARLLDPTCKLQAGIPLCPPEGDAGTGMVATNTISENKGNVSIGTSAFAMFVLEKPLSRVYEELDIIATPTGNRVAMAHANNCSSDINAWVTIFNECLSIFGLNIPSEQLYKTLFNHSLKGEQDCGKLLSYGFYSGEPNIGLIKGCPIFLHPIDSNFNLANFIKVHIYSAFAAMKLGVDTLLYKEHCQIQQVLAHGGMLKTEGVAQKILASALNIPIATMTTAGEGGAWGIALLANYLESAQQSISLEAYLSQNIFHKTPLCIIEPDQDMHQGYEKFLQSYIKGLPIVKTATNQINN